MSRKTIHSTAHGIRMPKTTFHRYAKKHGVVIHHSSAVKPLLTAKNEDERVEFAVKRINERTGRFEDMEDRIMFDEKWYSLMETTTGFYLVPDEPIPHRKAKSKRFIPHIMFMAVNARPRYDPHRKKIWDGKIGIFPMLPPR